MHIVDPLNNSSQIEQSDLDAALVRAVEEGDVEGVKLLLEKQANPNLKGEAGWSPMTHAAYEGSAAVFNELLNYGGDVSTYDDVNNPPFYWAAARGNIDICRRILELGPVDINHQGNHGISPAMAAAEQGKIEVLQLLINHGADLTLLKRRADGSAANACSFAESRNHKEIVDLIVETIGSEAAYKYKDYQVADVEMPYVLANAGEYLSITYKGNQLVVMVENISYVFNNVDCQISVGKTNTSSFNLLSLIPVLKEYQPIELGSYDDYYQKNAEIVDFIKGFDSGNRLNEFDVVKLSECMKRNEYELNKTDLMLAYKKFQENDLI